MTKYKVTTVRDTAEVIGVAGAVAGLFSIAILFVIGSYLAVGWLADTLYSDIFEAQGYGPTISYWQFVFIGVLAKWVTGFSNLTTKKSD